MTPEIADKILEMHQELLGAREWRQNQAEQTISLKLQVGQCSEKIDGLERAVNGNGRMGLLDRMTTAEGKIERLNENRASVVDVTEIQATLAAHSKADDRSMGKRDSRWRDWTVIAAAIIAAVTGVWGATRAANAADARTGTTQVDQLP